jgi:cation diffusion facilitator family transporter
MLPGEHVVVNSESKKASAARLRRFSAWLSLGIGFLMLMMKMGGYVLTGSSAILSDALESVVHVVATGFALFSVILAARPPDRSHPYGHGKIEYFSAGFEGALIIFAAVAIIYEALPALIRGPELRSLDIGAYVVAAAGAINLFLGLYLIRTGRRTHSLILEADGRHVLTDSFTSLGVLVGLLLVMATGWTPLDPLIAIAVALNIIVTGVRLVRQSVHGLMDAAQPQSLTDIVRVLSEKRRPGWIDLHRLRVIRSGDQRHVDLHLTVPRFWDIKRGHDEQDCLGELVGPTFFGRTEAIVHLDPCVDACCEFCDYEPCPVRAAPCLGARAWDVPRAVAPADYLDDDSD